MGWQLRNSAVATAEPDAQESKMAKKTLTSVGATFLNQAIRPAKLIVYKLIVPLKISG
jgi:hypothetical protein